MSTQPTMSRAEISINGESMFLAQHQDVENLKREFERAAQTEGAWVDFVVVGNRSVHVLISAHTTVIISVGEVPFDARDTGDEAHPFDPAP